KFEIIIYDTILAPEDGHNEIIVQYQTANRWNSSTVGIEDPTNQIAICCLFNDTLHRGAAPWTPGKAIKYTTRQAVSIAELNSKDIAPMLIFQPNPFRNCAKIAWTVNKPTFTHINIYDYSGRLVRNLFNEYLLKPGVYFINWNGKNNCGEKVSSGIYFIRLETEFGTRIFKTIKLNQD
ncbi:MAG: T9SS type A sorting domain-containing protein, partial [candidate division WOR-3 bacterium]